MRKYILMALVLLVTGIAVSVYILPSSREVAGMQSADVQAVDLGKVDVEAEYAQGRRSYAIVAALADKRVAGGDRVGAIKYLRSMLLPTAMIPMAAKN